MGDGQTSTSMAAKYNANLDDHHHSSTKKVEPTKNKSDFKCTFCDLTFKQRKSLMPHIRQIHTLEKPYKCQHPNCESTFAASSQLRMHQKVHNKEKPRLLKFRCSICPYKTGLQTSLKDHLKTHSDVKEFSCDFCAYRAKHSGSIKRRQKLVHSSSSETRKFKCPHPNCEYSFKLKYALTEHLFVHSDEQPFVCPVAQCGFKTKFKVSLATHQRVHSEEKPLKCSFCPYASKFKASLVAHIRTHTGETPYPCKSCSYRSKTSHSLARHVKRMHQGKKRRFKKERCAANRSLQMRRVPLKCKIVGCDFATRDDFNFAVHLNQAHNLPRVTLTKL